MKETKEEFIKKMLDKKADEDSIIDLNAYGIGLEEMYEALNLDIAINRRELLIAFFNNLKEQVGTYRINSINTERAIDVFFKSIL